MQAETQAKYTKLILVEQMITKHDHEQTWQLYV